MRGGFPLRRWVESAAEDSDCASFDACGSEYGVLEWWKYEDMILKSGTSFCEYSALKLVLERLQK